MAQGDLTLFQKFGEDLVDGVHDLDNDSIRVCFIDATTTPTAADASPIKATYTEVSGGNFTAGGDTMTVTTVRSGATTTVDFSTNINNAATGTNPTDVRYALIYNDTTTTPLDACIGFVEISTTGFDATTGALTLDWNASGVFTIA